MGKFAKCVVWLLIAPGDLLADRLGVTHENNRDLIRMLINSLFWIMVAIFGLWLWTSSMPEFQ